MSKAYRKAYLTFRDQIRRCYDEHNKSFQWYGAKGIRVEYSLEEFSKWYIKQNPHALNGFSVGRKDHSNNYTLDNIEFQTRAENRSEEIARNGTPRPRRKVIAYKNGLEVGRFESTVEAAEKLGCFQGNVHACLIGKRKTHHGYTFSEGI